MSKMEALAAVSKKPAKGVGKFLMLFQIKEITVKLKGFSLGG
jgi:hypothetical protein